MVVRLHLCRCREKWANSKYWNTSDLIVFNISFNSIIIVNRYQQVIIVSWLICWGLTCPQSAANWQAWLISNRWLATARLPDSFCRKCSSYWRTEIARRAFSQAASTIWNGLPVASRSAVVLIHTMIHICDEETFLRTGIYKLIVWLCMHSQGQYWAGRTDLCMHSHDSSFRTTYEALPNAYNNNNNNNNNTTMLTKEDEWQLFTGGYLCIVGRSLGSSSARLFHHYLGRPLCTKLRCPRSAREKDINCSSWQ